MAGSVSKTILIGNVGSDPEIRTMQNGNKVANFSLATSETWKDKNTGERKESTEWHKVVVFDKNLVPIVEQYIKKGSKLFIEGQNKTRKWTDSNGVEKYSTEVVVQGFNSSITMLDSRGGEQAPEQQSAPKASVPEDFSDDIPFAKVHLV